MACRAVVCLIGCVSDTAYPFFLGTKIKAPLCAGLFKALRGSAVSKRLEPWPWSLFSVRMEKIRLNIRWIRERNVGRRRRRKREREWTCCSAQECVETLRGGQEQQVPRPWGRNELVCMKHSGRLARSEVRGPSGWAGGHCDALPVAPNNMGSHWKAVHDLTCTVQRLSSGENDAGFLIMARPSPTPLPREQVLTRMCMWCSCVCTFNRLRVEGSRLWFVARWWGPGPGGEGGAVSFQVRTGRGATGMLGRFGWQMIGRLHDGHITEDSRLGRWASVHLLRCRPRGDGILKLLTQEGRENSLYETGMFSLA